MWTVGSQYPGVPILARKGRTSIRIRDNILGLRVSAKKVVFMIVSKRLRWADEEQYVIPNTQ
jgi:hypothetical protein